MSDLLTTQLLSPLYASAAMRAIMSDRARLQRMLDFEAALARAEAAVGIIPATGAVEIGEACQADRYNISTLAEAAASSGDVAAAAINALTLEVARRNKQAAGFVHWGATGQDVIDTALVLELRAAIDALLVDLDIAIKGFTTLAGRHRRTVTAARILLQQALPMPFGLKLAGYAAALARSRERLARLRREALMLQFGGAAGTLAALGDRGLGVAERLAALLDLPLPEAPWHSHRDRLAEVAASFAILAGTCGKIARDVAQLMQIELGEVSEPRAAGRDGSSTLPHMHNPSSAMAALSAAAATPNLVATILALQTQDHERGLGGWQTEWVTFPVLALMTSGALDAVVAIAEAMEIDVERMRENLEISGGRVMSEALAFALAEKMGWTEAHRLVQELVRRSDEERRPLKDTLAADLRVKSQLSSTEIEKLFVPLTYQGSAQQFIDRLVMATQGRPARRAEARPPEPRLPVTPQLSPGTAPQDSAPKPAATPTPPAASPPQAPQPAAVSDAPPTLPPAANLPLAPQSAAGSDIAPAPVATDVPPTPEKPTAQQPMQSAPEPAADDDSPGALMDMLSRADAEAQAALSEDKQKPS
jgi:3-carboxy-cis,cis-muconate cycloisomerase